MVNLELMQKIRKSESGVVAIELALVLPVMLMILLGTISFGVAMTNYIIITNGVREAARWAAINSTPDNRGFCRLTASPTPQDPCQVFRSYVNTKLISLGPINELFVTKTIATALTGDPATIEASYRFSTLLVFPSDITIRTSATMVHE